MRAAHKDEGAGACDANPPTQPTDNGSQIIDGDEDIRKKPLTRLKAHAALRGVSVFDLADGSLLVSRWGLTRAVPDVCALAQFLRQIGVPL